MNNDRFFEKLLPYADGELDAQERAELEAHLEQCPDCRAELEQFQTLFQSLRNAQPEDPGEVFWQKFQNGVREQIEAAPRARRAPGAAVMRRAALAAALLAALISGVWFLRPEPQPRQQAAPNAPVSQAAKPKVDKTDGVAAAEKTTPEELVIIAALNSPAMAHDTEPRPVPGAAAEMQETETAAPSAAFPFEMEDIKSLAAISEDDIYLFDDKLTSAYIMPEVLNDLTDEEARSVLQSLESEDPDEQSAMPQGVS